MTLFVSVYYVSVTKYRKVNSNTISGMLKYVWFNSVRITASFIRNMLLKSWNTKMHLIEIDKFKITSSNQSFPSQEETTCICFSKSRVGKYNLLVLSWKLWNICISIQEGCAVNCRYCWMIIIISKTKYSKRQIVKANLNKNGWHYKFAMLCKYL